MPENIFWFQEIAVVMEDTVVRRICTKVVVIPVPDLIESPLPVDCSTAAGSRCHAARELYGCLFPYNTIKESAVNTRCPTNGEACHIFR